MKRFRTAFVISLFIFTLAIQTLSCNAMGCAMFEDPVVNALIEAGYEDSLSSEEFGNFALWTLQEMYRYYNPLQEAYMEANRHRAVAGKELNPFAEQTVEYFYSLGGADGAYQRYLKSKCKHSYVEQTRIEATCKAKGKVTLVCNLCGTTKSQTLEAIDHHYQTSSLTSSTCVEPGLETMTCTMCGKELVNELPLTDHDYEKSDASKEPCCINEGEHIFECSVCGDTYIETIAALGHQLAYEKIIVNEPNCVMDGMKAKKCELCGELFEKEVIDSLGHVKSTDTQIDIPATYWKAGTSHFYCTVCNEVLENIETPATGGNTRYVIISAGSISALTGLSLVIKFILKFLMGK